MKMLAQTIYNTDYDWTDNFAQMNSNVSNPATVFELAMQEIGEIYQNLEMNYGVSVDDMEKFLESHDPDVIEKLNNLWTEVDNDIYGEFQNATLSPRRYLQWRNSLDEWIKMFESTVRLFIYREFDKVFEIPRKLQLKAA
jgi:hypothetical protein